MKKTKTLFIAFSLMGLLSCNQDLTCADFKTGKFYIPETKEEGKLTIIKNDSVFEQTYKIDPDIQKYIIIREKNSQIEWTNEVGNGQPAYVNIEWIDDCSYRLTYDSSKSESEKGNGVIVTKRKIENNCFFYTASSTTSEGETISQDGIICKE